MATSSSEESRQVIKGMYDALIRGDQDGFFAGMHEDFESVQPAYLPWGDVHHGPDGFKRECIPSMVKTFDLTTIEIESIVAEDDHVAATIHLGVFGSDVSVILGENWIMRDGKAWRLRHDGFKLIVSLLDENEQSPRYVPGRALAMG